MTAALILTALDGDTGQQLTVALDRTNARQVAIALERQRQARQAQAEVELPQLNEALRAALVAFAGQSSVTESHGASRSITVASVAEAGPDARREYLSRADVARLAAVSFSTVDRWVRTGRLPSVKVDGIRRIAHDDLVALLSATVSTAGHA